MPGLEPSCYPHIADFIFDSADLDDLSSLSAASEYWRQRYDAEFYHLRDFAARYDASEWRHASQLRERPVLYYQFTTKSGRVESRVTDPRVLAASRVVDLHTCTNVLGISDTAVTMPLQSIRVPYPDDGYVPLDFFMVVVEGSRLIFDNHYGFGMYHAVRKLVINFRNSDFLHWTTGVERTPCRQASEIVIIVHDHDGESRNQAEMTWCECSRFMRGSALMLSLHLPRTLLSFNHCRAPRRNFHHRW